MNEQKTLKRDEVLFVGMGNRIKKDDGVGIYITNELEKKEGINVIVAENSIENYLGKINAQNINAVVFIDAVDFGKEPGYTSLLPVKDIHDSTTNTHNLSLKTISGFLEASEIQILGIQPREVGFGFGLSEKIEKVADKIIESLLNNSTINPKHYNYEELFMSRVQVSPENR